MLSCTACQDDKQEKKEDNAEILPAGKYDFFAVLGLAWRKIMRASEPFGASVSQSASEAEGVGDTCDEEQTEELNGRNKSG